MISKERVQEVETLLAQNELSQRAIARITGVSRVVVHRIATGKRRIMAKPPKGEWEENRTGKPFERCLICGSKVQLPCVACIIRRIVREKKVARFYDVPNNSLKLDLEDKHRVRYEQVKAWRESQDDPEFTELPEDWPFRRKRMTPNLMRRQTTAVHETDYQIETDNAFSSITAQREIKQTSITVFCTDSEPC